jgi:hypothetical protein
LKAGLCFCLQVKRGRGQKAYLLGLLVEIASYLDSNNFEMSGIRPVDNDNHLREKTHKYTDGHSTCLYKTPKSTTVIYG